MIPTSRHVAYATVAQAGSWLPAAQPIPQITLFIDPTRCFQSRAPEGAPLNQNRYPCPLRPCLDAPVAPPASKTPTARPRGVQQRGGHHAGQQSRAAGSGGGGGVYAVPPAELGHSAPPQPGGCGEAISRDGGQASGAAQKGGPLNPRCRRAYRPPGARRHAWHCRSRDQHHPTLPDPTPPTGWLLACTGAGRPCPGRMR